MTALLLRVCVWEGVGIGWGEGWVCVALAIVDTCLSVSELEIL